MGYAEQPRRIVRPGQPGPRGPRGSPLGSPGSGHRLIGGAGAPRRAVAAPGPDAVRRELYRPRPKALTDALRRLDAGLDQQARRQLAEWVREEFEAAYATVPLGFVARCHLGPPYVDHQLDLFQVIVRHFTPAETMPDPFSAARMPARSGGYAHIEVYSDGLVLPVLDDGTVVRP